MTFTESQGEGNIHERDHHAISIFLINFTLNQLTERERKLNQ